jgi:hypothetical protein
MKDKMALFWIDKLIVKARETQKERIDADPRLKDKTLNGEARKKVKRRIKDLVQWQLYNWVILQPEDRYEKLPEKSGEINLASNSSRILLIAFSFQRNGINCDQATIIIFFSASEASLPAPISFVFI